MPPVHRCPASGPAAGTAGQPLRSADDALRILLAGGGPHPPCVTGLLLDARRRGLACVEVQGRGDVDAAADVVETILAAADLEPDVAGLVVGCFRTAPALVPAPGEECCFLELRETCDDVGIELIDWFVVVGHHVTSVADATGVASRWPSLRQVEP